MDKSYENINIFNRSIFGKATKKEMEKCIKYYTEEEDFEKCMVIKELINLEYYTEKPVYEDLEKISKIIDEHKNDLEDLTIIGDDLIKKISEEEDKEIDDILDDIDDVSDDIITNILESSKLKNEYLKSIYEEITKIDMPEIDREKPRLLLEKYRENSIDNLKNILKDI